MGHEQNFSTNQMLRTIDSSWSVLPEEVPSQVTAMPVGSLTSSRIVSCRLWPVDSTASFWILAGKTVLLSTFCRLATAALDSFWASRSKTWALDFTADLLSWEALPCWDAFWAVLTVGGCCWARAEGLCNSVAGLLWSLQFASWLTKLLDNQNDITMLPLFSTFLTLCDKMQFVKYSKERFPEIRPGAETLSENICHLSSKYKDYISSRLTPSYYW